MPTEPDLVSRMVLGWIRMQRFGRTLRRQITQRLTIMTRSVVPGRAMQGGAPQMALEALRIAMDRPSFPMRLSEIPLRRVMTLRVPGGDGLLPARLYVPRGKPRGAVLFLHGGGYVHCGLNSHHGICCRLARESGAVVLSLDYRLAPEHRFPAAVEDSWAALRWLSGEAWRWGGGLAVAGDSAGAGLSAAVAHRARGAGGPDLTLQLLYYPATHAAQHFPSRDHFGEGYLLTMRMMGWYGAQYARSEADFSDPEFAPGLAEDFTNLAPAVIVTAACDPMRDEGAAYARSLEQAGVPVRYWCAPGTLHGFLNFYAVMRMGKVAIRFGGQSLRHAFAARQPGSGS